MNNTRNNSKSRLMATVALATVLIGLTSCHKKDTTDSMADISPVIDVALPVVDSVTIYKTYPGYLTANASVDLVARVNGYLLSHPYSAGDYVSKGQVLFNIESKQYQEAVNEAKAQLANQQAQYDYYVKNYEAMQKAYQSDAVSKMDVLQAQSNMETSLASVNNAKASLATAMNNLSYCTVRAPFSGRISSTPFSDGAYLAGEGSPVTLAQLYDDHIVIANFNIDDDELIALINGDAYSNGSLDLHKIPVEFGDTLPSTYTADLSYLSPVLDVSTGKMVVQAHINNDKGELRPGMIASVKFPTSFVKNGIMIEDAAIGKDQLGSYIYVVNDSDKVIYTPITTGDLVTPTMRLVTKGVNPGDKYVTKALLKVRDGMKVTPRMN